MNWLYVLSLQLLQQVRPSSHTTWLAAHATWHTVAYDLARGRYDQTMGPYRPPGGWSVPPAWCRPALLARTSWPNQYQYSGVRDTCGVRVRRYKPVVVITHTHTHARCTNTPHFHKFGSHQLPIAWSKYSPSFTSDTTPAFDRDLIELSWPPYLSVTFHCPTH